MRHLRKLAKTRSFVREVQVERWSVDERTGVVKIRKRTVKRKIAYLKGRQRGFLSVNDGPSTAIDIARIIARDAGRDLRDGYELVS
ncbi:MAG TPA: hypothetical protein VNT53_05145 [Pseudolysinimonas sp.]|nr:hypothetical protein [Pseudolysinimonas sp.]